MESRGNPQVDRRSRFLPLRVLSLRCCQLSASAANSQRFHRTRRRKIVILRKITGKFANRFVSIIFKVNFVVLIYHSVTPQRSVCDANFLRNLLKTTRHQFHFLQLASQRFCPLHGMLRCVIFAIFQVTCLANPLQVSLDSSSWKTLSSSCRKLVKLFVLQFKP